VLLLLLLLSRCCPPHRTGDGSAAAGSDGAVSVSNDTISFVFSPEPVTHLGNGRPLGFHYDHEDNLVVCDSLKVRYL
jgi:hypothetical protein